MAERRDAESEHSDKGGEARDSEEERLGEEENQQAASGSDDDSEDYEKLDEEDLDLIAENRRELEEEEQRSRKRAQAESHSGLGEGRLKRVAALDDSDEDDDEMPSGDRPGGRIRETLFDDDADGVGDYAAEDGYDEGYGVQDYDEEGISGGDVVFSMSQQQQLREIFGDDLATVSDIIAGRRSRGIGEDGVYGQTQPSEYSQGHDEPMGTSYHLDYKSATRTKTPPSEIIRITDIPERLQDRFRHRPRPVPPELISSEAAWMIKKLKDYCTRLCPLPLRVSPMGQSGGKPAGALVAGESAFGKPSLVSPFPLCDLFNDSKQRQAYDEIFKGSGDDSSREDRKGGHVFFPPNKSIEEDIEEKTALFLVLLLDDRLEVPFIATHRAHLLFPPLTVEALWKIYEWDLIWWRMNDTRRSLLVDAGRLAHATLPNSVQKMIEESEDVNELNDCRTYLNFASENKRNSNNIGENDMSSPLSTSASRGLKKRRVAAPADTLYNKFFADTNAMERISSHILDQEVYIKALEACEAELIDQTSAPNESFDRIYEIMEAQSCTPPDSPADLQRQQCVPGEEETLVTTWLKTLPLDPTLINSARIFELITRYQGYLLALHPGFRRIIRTWFYENCSVSSTTTAKGERVVEPGKSSWIPCRLFKKPIEEFWTRTSINANSINKSPSSVRNVLEEISNDQSGNEINEYERWRLQLAAEFEVNKHLEFGLEIAKAEKQEWIDVVIHPLCGKDTTGIPWRGTNSDDLRWIRGKTKCQTQKRPGRSPSSAPPTGETDYYEREYRMLMQSDKDDEALIQELANKLTAVLAGRDPNAAWKHFLREIVYSAVTRESLGEFRREIKQRLVKESTDYVLDLCQRKLLWKLALGPPTSTLFKHKSSRERRGPTFPDIQALVENDEDERDDIIEEEDVGASERDDEFKQDRSNSYESSTLMFSTPSVVSLIVEKVHPTQPAAANVHLALVNRQGVGTDYRVFKYLYSHILGDSDTNSSEGIPDEAKLRMRALIKEDIRNEVKTFENLLLNKRTRPNMVVVGSSHPCAVELYNYLEHLSRNRLKFRKYSFSVHWVSMEVPTIFAQSPRCPIDIRDNHSIYAVQGLSAARLVQNPLAETLNLWQPSSNEDRTEYKPNCLTSLRLHPLQVELPQQSLEESLATVIVHVVNLVGVFINKLRTVKHLRPLLQFVAGFGPIKAASFIHNFTSPITSRKGLTQCEKHSLGDETFTPSVGETVFWNCASFIRIRPGEEFGNEVDDEVNCLDDSRIHPDETAQIAQKMCRDAQEEVTDRGVVEKSLERPETLDELDLEAYATILSDSGKMRMLPVLECIKREIFDSFGDPRFPFESPSKGELFFQFAGDDPTELAQGSSVTVQVDAERPRLILSLTSNGFDVDILDLNQYQHYEPSKRLTVSQIVRGRVARIRTEDLFVDVVVTPPEISRLLDKFAGHNEQNPSVLSPLISKDLEIAGSHTRKKPGDYLTSDVPKTRRIAHPRMRNITHLKLLHLLKQNDLPGQAYFRSSETNNNQLILYMQTLSNPFHYKSIRVMESEERTSAGVGAELTLCGDKFYALDEILGSFCGPFSSFIEDVTAHEKYHSGITAEDLEAKLMNSTSENSRLIKWGICADKVNESREPHERFQIIVVSSSSKTGAPKVLKDSLYVSSRGYRIWLKQSNNIQKLLDWYKTEGFKDKYLGEYQQQKHQMQTRQQRYGGSNHGHHDGPYENPSSLDSVKHPEDNDLMRNERAEMGNFSLVAAHHMTNASHFAF